MDRSLFKLCQCIEEGALGFVHNFEDLGVGLEGVGGSHHLDKRVHRDVAACDFDRGVVEIRFGVFYAFERYLNGVRMTARGGGVPLSNW